MMRILLQYLLPLLLPTLIYFLWVRMNKRRIASRSIDWVHEGPWFWLILAGVALMAASLVFVALTGGVEPGSRIIAPTYKDGRVVPWHVE